MKRVLMIDNYDSFTYNLVQLMQVQGAEVLVYRNDRITVEEALALNATHLVISPGPGTPDDAGVSMALIKAMLGKIPILGVCLGHQSLAQVLGGTVLAAQKLMHGKSSMVYHDSKQVYLGLANPFQAGRYHSLAVAEDNLPECLEVTSYTSDGEIMGLRHRELMAEGVQFHPESIMTPAGDRLIRNFLEQRIEK